MALKERCCRASSRGWREGPSRFRHFCLDNPGAVDVHIYLAYLYRRIGRRDDAEKLLEEALRLDHQLLASGTDYYEVPLNVAYVHVARGEKDEALYWLDRALQAGWRGWTTAKWTPLLDPLREDGRFQALMHRIDDDVAAMRRRATLG